MPRLYDSCSNPYDFCQRHFPDEEAALAQFGNVGDGPDGRGNCFSYDDDHPPYADTDYRCATCNRLLRAADDYWKE